MLLKNLLKIANELIKKYPPDAEVWLDDENVMVLSDGERIRYDPEDLLLEGLGGSDAQINWDGISAVRAWNKGKKQRVYFRAVGVPDSAHKQGKVFLEMVNGYWMPNMRYQLMQSLANQLNDAKIFSAEEVEEKYREYIEE